jgi:hypothetical protein
MDKQILAILSPDETQLADELAQVAGHIKPDTQFSSNLEARLLHPNPIVSHSVNWWTRGVRIASIAVAVFVILVITTLTIPPLRTIAQEVIDSLFNRVTSDQETVELGERGIIQLVPYFFGTVEEAEAKAGFDIRAPTLLPEGLTLHDVTYSPEEQLVSLNYFTGTLQVLQGPLENGWSDNPVLSVGASADVIPVEFSGANQTVTAEFVKGFWKDISVEAQFVLSPSDEATLFDMEWRSDSPICRLRWQENDMLYELWSWGGRFGDACQLGMEELVDIAESMQ